MRAADSIGHLRWRSFGLVVGAALFLAGCKPEIDFTRLPPVGPPSPQPLAVTTLITVDMPLAVEAERIALAEALPTEPRKLYAWLESAACAQVRGVQGSGVQGSGLHAEGVQGGRATVGRGRRCVGANVTGEVVRAGTARLDTIEGRPAIVVPYDYRLAIRGTSWARDQREVRSGQLVVAYPLNVTIGAEFELRVQPLASPVVFPSVVPALAGELALTEPITRALGLAARAATRRTAIRSGLAPAGNEPTVLNVRAAMERVWQALHEPIPLGDPRKPRFLQIEPTGLSAMGVTAGDIQGSLAYRFGIEARTTLVEVGEPRPAPLLARPLAPPPFGGRIDAASKPEGSRLRTRFDVPLEPLRAAVRAAVAAEPTVNTAPAETSDVTTDRIVATLARADVFATREQLAIGLTLQLPGPLPPLDLIGRAFMVGTPTLSDDGRRIQIDRLGLTEPPTIRTVGLPVGTIDVTLPLRPAAERHRHVDLAPLAARLAQAARLPFDGELDKALTALAADIVGKPGHERNSVVSGVLGASRVVAIVPGRDHMTILVDVDAVLKVRAADILARARPSATLEPTQWQAPAAPARAAKARR